MPSGRARWSFAVHCKGRKPTEVARRCRSRRALERAARTMYSQGSARCRLGTRAALDQSVTDGDRGPQDDGVSREAAHVQPSTAITSFMRSTELVEIVKVNCLHQPSPRGRGLAAQRRKSRRLRPSRVYAEAPTHLRDITRAPRDAVLAAQRRCSISMAHF